MRLALALVTIVLFAIVAFAVESNGTDRATLLLFSLVVPMMALNLRFTVLPLGSARMIAVGNVASQLVFAGGVFLLVQTTGDAIRVPLIQAAGEGVFSLILLARVFPMIGLVIPKIDAAEWRRQNLRDAGPLMVSKTSSATALWFDSLLIAFMIGNAKVGLYSAAYKPVLFLNYSISLLFVSFLAAYAALPSERSRTELLSRTVRTAAAPSLAAAVALAAGSSLVIPTLRRDYSGAVVPMAVLAVSIPLTAMMSVFANVLVSVDRPATIMRHNLVGLLFNISANLIAVPTTGLTGAAAVAVATIALVGGLNYRSCVALGHAPPPLALLTGRTAALPRPGDHLAAGPGEAALAHPTMGLTAALSARHRRTERGGPRHQRPPPMLLGTASSDLQGN